MAARALSDKKGREIQVLEIGGLTTLADYFVIATGSSNTQINALVDNVEKVLREEAEEFIAAVRSGDREHMREELGDILLQVMFHSELAEREGAFTIEDVIGGLIDKLTRRHPHVFAGTVVGSSREVVENWNRIKAGERRRGGGGRG